MTTFKRRGHWRTNKYGVRYWVNGHSVDRYDWYRSSYGLLDYISDRLYKLDATNSFTAQYVCPNATCPVCGKPVFFYQNEYGSKVFFDELGPPWPKHPCTDHSDYRKRRFKIARKPKFPSVRDTDSIEEIAELLENSGFDRSEEFAIEYGAASWPAWTLRRKLKVDDGTLLVASAINPSNTKLLYLMIEKNPRNISVGDTIFYRRNCVEFLSPKSLKPTRVTVEKFSGATQFVQKLIE